MTYATTPATGHAVSRPRALASGRRRRAQLGGAVAAVGASLIVPSVLLAAVCAMSGSLATHSVARASMAMDPLVRADPYGRRVGATGLWRNLAVDQPDLADDGQDITASIGPVEAGRCGRDRAGDETLDIMHPTLAAHDLFPAGRRALAGPPCVTIAERRATAVAAVAGMLFAPDAPMKLAMSVAATPGPAKQGPRIDMERPAPQRANLVLPPADTRQRLHGDDAGGDSMPPLDGRTAIYDISARKVYLPNGRTLEAHSGLGRKMDDPRFVHVKMEGATPPNVYDLRLREALFHGVQAIRLTPAVGSKMFGRDGILAHSYLLGPNGQSNGCVSFRDYPAFLQAFLKGEVKRIVVVARLPSPPAPTTVAQSQTKDRYALND